MPRGSKAKYTTKQKRKATHIEEGYEDRRIRPKEAARRAWATVNKESGGGKKSGSGRGKPENRSASRKSGRLGDRAATRRPLSLRPRGGNHTQAARGAPTISEQKGGEAELAGSASIFFCDSVRGSWSAASHDACHQRHQEENDEDPEQQPRAFHCDAGHATEPDSSRNQGHH